MIRPLSVVLAAFLLSASNAHADLIIGQVVDSNGVGVPGIDIDVENLGSGGDPDIFNDGTDPNGFFSTTVPAGLYQIFFKPPAPPTTTHLTAILSSVVVVGTTDLGVITLPPGVGLTGRAVDANGFPVANVNLDVTDLTTGEALVLKDARTDLFGNFGVAVPRGPVHLDFDPGAMVVPPLVPQRLALSPLVDTVLGDVLLPPGLLLSGILTDSTSLPVVGTDLDIFDSLTGDKLYTPRDNTNTLGAFSIALEAGLYDVEICPSPASLLVGFDQEGVVLTTDLDLGSLVLQSGVVLSGTVRDIGGMPLAGIDVDVSDSLTGASIVTCGDDTNVSGFYSVIVPTGLLDIGFAPPGRHGTSAEDLYTFVTISASTMLDGTIPAPVAGFVASPASGIAPLQVSFQDTSTGAVTAWDWSFGDGGASPLGSPTHVYTLPGTYSVALVVDGIGGPSTSTGIVQVMPDIPPPAAAFSGTPTAGTVPLTVGFVDASTGSVTSWSWSFGDGGTSVEASPAYTFVTPGTYTVSLTVNGPSGADTQTSVDYIQAMPVPPPVAAFDGAPSSGSSPLAVSFTDLSTGSPTAWSWDFGDGSVSVDPNPLHIYTRPGTYDVALTASNEGGSDTLTLVDFVVVDRGPAFGPPAPGTAGSRSVVPFPSFTAQPRTGKAPLVVAFFDTSAGGATSWLWDFGDGTSSAANNPIHIYDGPGAYDVGLTVSNSSGSRSVTYSSYIFVRARLERGSGAPASGGTRDAP